MKTETALVLSQFGQQVGRARQVYLKFLKDGLALGQGEQYYQTVDQRFLGDEGFIKEVEQWTGASQVIEVRPRQGPLSGSGGVSAVGLSACVGAGQGDVGLLGPGVE